MAKYLQTPNVCSEAFSARVRFRSFNVKSKFFSNSGILDSQKSLKKTLISFFAVPPLWIGGTAQRNFEVL